MLMHCEYKQRWSLASRFQSPELFHFRDTAGRDGE